KPLGLDGLFASRVAWFGIFVGTTVASSCGSSTSDGTSADGSTSGTGGSGPSIACYDDGGKGLTSAARGCVTDTDCQAGVGRTCCGADNAFGIAKAQAQAYATCLGGGGNCGGLGCAKFLGYRVDTGEMTEFQGANGDALAQVAVHCKDQLCTTSVIPQ